ncbi:flagellar protein FlaG [Massilia sp. DJPM01]|uniref:flagellar protein FlaG n=1 Tax=Massilia sp. DJPM01 TaxID=3024404 RepID=UPI00259EE2BD|nr:flagellar protein FlaG [Massilia sp. DJPM01]MDM5178533.1 flagellar protein FlaG [Massilia sp. DJPM01]
MELRPLDNAPAAPPLRPAAPENAFASARTAAPAAAAAGKSAPARPPAEPDPREVSKVVGEINVAMQALSRNIEFSIDTDSQRTVVKIIDQTTKEVIRQMPTAEALEIGKALEKVQGLLIRQTA